MATNLTSVIAVIVFAGGPHTESRLDRALERLDAAAPRVLYLSGHEFVSKSRYRTLADRVGVPVRFDPSRSTLTSVYRLSRRLRKDFPEGGRILVVTSNYHAPRVRWLLRGLLPSAYALSWRTTPDIRFADLSRNETARKLILGECVSWLYCAPAGLLFRPLASASVLAAAGFLWIRRRRRLSGLRPRGHPR